MNEHSVTLISTGLTLGLVHVLAGPDHLSALAALSVGSSWRAFTLGFRWGIGHSTGLVVVAIVFISLKGELDLRTMGRYCDLLVGLFMIALGCFGVLGAVKTYREKHDKRDRDLSGAAESSLPLTPKSKTTHNPHNCKDSGGAVGTIHPSTSFEISTTSTGTSRSASSSALATLIDDDEEFLLNKNNMLSSGDNHSSSGNGGGKRNSSGGDSDFEFDHNHDHHHNFMAEDCPWCPFVDMHDPYTQRIVSFAIGLLHGVAGPGGILGVLPAVEMQNYQSSFLYLSSFIIASTLSMGTFAALYGELTKRIGATAENVELGLNIFSSAMSIIVGTIWFVLSLLGKLEGMFH